MRVATGTICHETSTFTPVATTRENYKEHFGYLKGAKILTKFRGTNTPVGGFIDAAQAHGFELIPTVFAEPHPSGPTPRTLFEDILNEMLDGIRNAGRIDGVLLELHGSMVAEEIDDAEGYILTAVRDLVGPDIPVVAQLDIHSNVSHRMVEMADALIGRETYPEVDMAARGRECGDVLVRIVREGLRPVMALHQIPMYWGMNQVTAHSPMKEAITELHRIEALPGVVCASIATCYPLADVPDMGASVYVVTDGDPALAQRCADELGRWIFDRKEQWHIHMPSTHEALAKAKQTGKFPVIFADRNDNTGGGSPGDSTGMLAAFVEAGLKDACVLYIVDPDAIAQCRKAGVGATITLDIGGKSTPLQGSPVSMTVEVMALSDGKFRYHGPMYAGMEGNMGPSVYIRQNGLHVLLVTQREQPFDTAFSESLGLDPRTMRYIGVKSAAHFRSGFESWAGAIHVVSEPSVHDARAVSFHRLSRNLYPLDTV
ncbi:MAG: M81 family metallopeptidase [candidate division Zixibacteria bacterium]|nr:M81 family metallopeptidase [candidate division Zixibacteria bacterium]